MHSFTKRLIGFLSVCVTICSGQPRTDTLLTSLFNTNQDPIFQEVIKHPDTYRLQIIYTQINRDKNNTPSFRQYYFHVDSTNYYSPASIYREINTCPAVAREAEQAEKTSGDKVHCYAI